MMVHPNMIPVLCFNQDDMRKLAEVMRAVSLESPDKIEGYQGSETETQAVERSAMVGPDIVKSGHLRFIQMPGRPLINVVLTLIENDTKKEWNLSMSHARPQGGPLRVADELATMIVGAFLGEGFEEVEAKAYWKTIRHYTKAAT